MFDPFYQEQARLVIWENNITLFNYEKDLEEGNKIEFDFINLVSSEKKNQKRVRIYEEDAAIIGSVRTADYVKDDIINSSLVESAWDPQRSLALK